MKNVKVNDTHNFAIVGHSGDGKTSLGEALLHAAGATPTLGTRRRRQLATSTTCPRRRSAAPRSQLRLRLRRGRQAPDAGRHARATRTSRPTARSRCTRSTARCWSCSAVGGVKVGTSRMWHACQRLGVPALAFVNGLDREHADFEAAVESLRALELKPVVLTLPIGAESRFSGVIDLLRMKALGQQGEGEIPAELADAARDARQQLVETVAECDDALLEKYLEEGALAEDEILRGLVAGTRTRAITPRAVRLGDAASWASRRCCGRPPSCCPRRPTAAPGRSRRAAPAARSSRLPRRPSPALVFKTMIDRYTGTLSVLRVVSGSLRPDLTPAATPAREPRSGSAS